MAWNHRDNFATLQRAVVSCARSPLRSPWLFGSARLVAAAGVLALVAVLLGACAARIPLPEHLRPSGTSELVSRMRAASVPLSSFSAEARLTYFGPDGRVKARADIVAARPASLRYDVRGPHGGVITAFATDGKELAALDVANSRFVYGPATVANIDRLLPFAPLGLTPEGWVRMLFGEIDVPPTADLFYNDSTGRFELTWQDGGHTRRVEVDPRTARPVRAQALVMQQAAAHVISDIAFDERNDQGLPTMMRIRVPMEKADIELHLRDIEADSQPEDDTFTINPPSGVPAEHL